MTSDHIVNEHAADADSDADAATNRVHHHARVDESETVRSDGTYTTLCGLRIRRRPDAAELPCCPMCALEMGGPCGA